MKIDDDEYLDCQVSIVSVQSAGAVPPEQLSQYLITPNLRVLTTATTGAAAANETATGKAANKRKVHKHYIWSLQFDNW